MYAAAHGRILAPKSKSPKSLHIVHVARLGHCGAWGIGICEFLHICRCLNSKIWSKGTLLWAPLAASHAPPSAAASVLQHPRHPPHRPRTVYPTLYPACLPPHRVPAAQNAWSARQWMCACRECQSCSRMPRNHPFTFPLLPLYLPLALT